MSSPACERSSDLMAFIYDEMNVSESREFEAHLATCVNCREEAASFGVVRESIVAWRDEVLAGFVPSTATPTRRSAVAAFKQFFNLSPLWLKGAAAFAVLTFFVLAGLVFVTSSKKQEVTTTKNDAIYTRQDVDRLVNEALAKQQRQQQQINDKATTTFAAATSPTANPPAPQKPSNKQSAKQTARNRRPLSRAEREQLAADLRLISIDDDLDLPGDRINQ